MIKVLVVDDYDLVRIGIICMFGDQEGICVVGQVDCGEEVVCLVCELSLDVVLMDIKMLGIGGFEVIWWMLCQDDGLCVIVVIVCEDELFLLCLLYVGVVGYLSKGVDLEEMVWVIKVVSIGQCYISLEIVQVMVLWFFVLIFDVLLDMFFECELQIMILIVNCYKVQDVVDQLCLLLKMVNIYCYCIFDKLGISSDVEMVLVVVCYGMVDVDEVNLV